MTVPHRQGGEAEEQQLAEKQELIAQKECRKSDYHSRIAERVREHLKKVVSPPAILVFNRKAIPTSLWTLPGVPPLDHVPQGKHDDPYYEIKRQLIVRHRNLLYFHAFKDPCT